jgi:hypothetical protein
MKKIFLLRFLVLISTIFVANTTVAHVPYLELKDYSESNPFIVRKLVTQSKAMYSWLEYQNGTPCFDIDVYKFELRRPIDMYVELIVPVCDGYYEDFLPWFALVGPGLPDPGQTLPFEVSSGYGAIVKENLEPGEPRESFYEFFGNKYYYYGPTFEEKLNETGTYYVYCWDPYDMGGDYTMVIGKAEIWGAFDIIRAFILTPLIRMGFELHIN